MTAEHSSEEGGEGRSWIAPTIGDPRLPDRFWAKVVPGPLGCWQWTASLATNGYGQFHLNGGKHPAHRLAYMVLVGDIPTDHVIDHLCRNRGCVNPAHLEPVTNRDNVLRGIGTSAQHARQTHCIHGHELTEDNVYVRPSRPNMRLCRECRRNHRRANQKRYRLAQRARRAA